MVVMIDFMNKGQIRRNRRDPKDIIQLKSGIS